jgi:hypothetical protein
MSFPADMVIIALGSRSGRRTGGPCRARGRVPPVGQAAGEAGADIRAAAVVLEQANRALTAAQKKLR